MSIVNVILQDESGRTIEQIGKNPLPLDALLSYLWVNVNLVSSTNCKLLQSIKHRHSKRQERPAAKVNRSVQISQSCFETRNRGRIRPER